MNQPCHSTRTPSRAIWIAIALMFMTPGGFISADDRVDFNRDIRPILSNRCFSCHGPDEGSRKSNLRLDSYEGAVDESRKNPAIVPHKSANSTLIKRIQSADLSKRMPPAEAGEALSLEQIGLIRKWIDLGGKYEVHWSFRPLTRPVPPVVQRVWGENPIDQFIGRRLYDAALNPSIEAKRSTLIRRVYLDLLGLLPSPQQSLSFIADPRPDAYEIMIDQALSSPHYGEKWGRHWLDQARYADTNGYTIDSERSMWPYRDWVIRALNDDVPFDQFTIEQLAGDLLDNPTQAHIVATGFHRNTLINQEGGTDAEQFRNEAAVDRVNTTGAVWLGLTIGCSQCHNHKFDPISQRSFYEMFAFFNSQQDVNSTSPTLRVASGQQQVRLRELGAVVARAQTELNEYDQKKNVERPVSERDDGKPVQWQIVNVVESISKAGAIFQELDDESILATGENGDNDEYTVRLALPQSLEQITGLRVETLIHPSLPNGGPGRAGNGNFVLNRIELRAPDRESKWLHATADHSQKDYPVLNAIDGSAETGWAINVTSGQMNVNRTAVFITQPIPVKSAKEFQVKLFFGKPAKYNIGRFRIAVSSAPLAKFKLPDAGRRDLELNLKKSQDTRKKFAAAIPQTMVMRELAKPRPTFVHIRGDFLRKGEAVQPKVPNVLPQLADNSSRSYNRLDLAEWIVRDDNPLTARVTVNRVWSRLFGVGLVETENDFGVQGTPPTHPDLLDWLATEFADQNWSMKKLLRLIVTSATYRQSSELRDDLVTRDPRNKLLGRQNRLRVDAELVRDIALTASGVISRRIGGPSVYPPQPSGVYAFTQRQATWPTSKGQQQYRRGLYTFFMRSAPYPMLTTFDSPRFNSTCTHRIRSNTPLQSLTMANDQTMVDFSRRFGARLIEYSKKDNDRIVYAFRVCFSRDPHAEESRKLIAFVNAMRKEFLSQTDDAAKLTGQSDKMPSDIADHAAYVLVARVLMNVDEFITRE